ATIFQVLFAALFGKPLPHLSLGSWRDQELLPIPRGPRIGIFRSKDLYLVTGLQLRFQCDQLAIDLRTDTAVSDLSVHGIRKVNGRRTRWQGNNITFRSESKNLLRR